MASDENHKPPYQEDDLDEDEDDSEELIDHHRNPNDDVLDEDELEEELEDEEEELEEDEDEEFHSDPTTSVTIAVPPPISLPEPAPTPPPLPQIPAVHEEKKIQPSDESRKLFQRLWTDEDEIELLQGFLEYTTSRGTSSSSSSHHHHYDTTQFYDQIKSKLQLDFNKNQLVEKLRRLKKKYRNVLTRISSGKDFAFKTPHDQATFEISRKIWSNLNNISSSAKDGGGGLDDEETNPNAANFSVNAHLNRSPNLNLNFGNSGGGFNNSGNCNYGDEEKKGQRSRKRSRVKIEEKSVLDERVVMGNSGVPGMVEETLRSCLSPLFKELLNKAMNGPCGVRGLGGGGGGMSMLSPLPLSFGNSGNLLGGETADEKWRKQQIMELEVYSKRLELVQDQIKAALDELRSAGS